jgi:hypothetical protein
MDVAFGTGMLIGWMGVRYVSHDEGEWRPNPPLASNDLLGETTCLEPRAIVLAREAGLDTEHCAFAASSRQTGRPVPSDRILQQPV